MANAAPSVLLVHPVCPASAVQEARAIVATVVSISRVIPATVEPVAKPACPKPAVLLERVSAQAVRPPVPPVVPTSTPMSTTVVAVTSSVVTEIPVCLVSAVSQDP